LLPNKYYEENKDLVCKANINFIAVMTMCENVTGMNYYFNKVQKSHPEIHNYERGREQVFSCGHMNDEARLFTSVITITTFKSKMKIAFLTPEYPHVLLVLQVGSGLIKNLAIGLCCCWL
jgi:hypothetical protein